MWLPVGAYAGPGDRRCTYSCTRGGWRQLSDLMVMVRTPGLSVTRAALAFLERQYLGLPAPRAA